MNELMKFDKYEILVKEGVFELVGYDELKERVGKLGEHLCAIEVTPDNVKENKKLVAEVRKACDKLNRERIDFKKEYLRPYDNLATQVKDLTDTVKRYEAAVRTQIWEIEQRERGEKRQEIETIFEKRRKHYGTEDSYPFDSFIEEWHLNKSTPMSKVESDMVEWFEGRKRDLEALNGFAENTGIEPSKVEATYQVLDNLADTMRYYNDVTKRSKDGIKRAKKEEREWRAVRVPLEDLKRTLRLLSENGIDYET